MKRKAIIGGIAALLMMFSCSVPAFALQPDRVYNYTPENEAVASPNLYEVKQVIYGNDIGSNNFYEPKDLFVDKNDQVYVLDSENARVVFLDENYRLVKTLDTFEYNGETTTISAGAEGIFYQESRGLLYIADTYNDRVIVSDRDGNVQAMLYKPETTLIEEHIAYQPSKVIVDNNDNIYVLSKNINTGAVMLDRHNNFLGFYGTNKVKETALVKMEKMWRKLLGTKDDEVSDYSFQPVQYNNLFWGTDRFIYAVSTKNEFLTSEVGKLNAVGDNVLVDVVFGDPNQTEQDVTSFVDITVDDDGFFTILDQYNCKLYTYDMDCNLVGVFGGIGEQDGLFKIPSSVSYNQKGDLLVLDSEKNCLTILSATYYQKKVQEATKLFHDGLYEESIAPWNEVLRMNVNFRLAYVGIGKANMMLGDYETAMENFKMGDQRVYYSDAKGELRDQTLKQNFALLAGVLIVLVIVLMFWEQVVRIVKFVIRLFKKNGGESQ